MAQVENPANLDRWANPAYRLLTVILIRCGLRISSAVSLSWDCVVTDAAGAPYLRYYNTKMKREALVPIDDELRAMISAQHDRIRRRWPDGTPVLFPRPQTNLAGTRPVGGATYRGALYCWLADCHIRDEHGKPVHLTPHQWRHTLGTVLKRCGVASDATFRAGRGEAVAGAAALPGGRRAGGRAAGHAVDQGLLAAGCAG